MSQKVRDKHLVLVSIGNTAYIAMVEMALGFQMVPSYTGALESM